MLQCDELCGLSPRDVVAVVVVVAAIVIMFFDFVVGALNYYHYYFFIDDLLDCVRVVFVWYWLVINWTMSGRRSIGEFDKMFRYRAEVDTLSGFVVVSPRSVLFITG